MCLFTVIICDGLAAYNIGKIPIPWIGEALLLLLIPLLIATRQLTVPRHLGSYLLFSFWLTLVTLAHANDDFASIQPERATTNYTVYIALRALHLVSFPCLITLTYNVLKHDSKKEVINSIVWIGTVLSLTALYIYVAQMFGLPEPPRNRLGTGGGAQNTVFTYAFHRAMGTFREPGHLAQWLIVPLFLSFTVRAGKQIHSTIIAATLLLTGSLTGMVGCAAGLLASILIAPAHILRHLRRTAAFAISAVIALSIFNVLSISHTSDRANLFQVLWLRIAPIIDGGMASSNRGYIYSYLSNIPLPWIGVGIGNANIVLSAALAADLTVSFLSLYFQTMMSGGFIALAILAYTLVRPLARAVKRGTSRRTMWCVAAYVAWLVMFGVDPEELTIMFGLIYGIILTYATHAPEPGQAHLLRTTNLVVRTEDAANAA